ncbi:MAG: serine hydrolase [Dongiaceae bacterium]
MPKLLQTLAVALPLALVILFPSIAHAKYASIVIDAQSGQVLSSVNPDAKRFPASLTKVMTLYMTFEALEQGRLKMNQSLPVSKNAAKRAPSKLYLEAGDRITVREAILALITRSANDAATVLAEGMGGSEAKFAQMMTVRAKQLGMRNTNFRNASGLPHSAQISTARDLATLSRAIIFNYPQYYKLFSTETFTFRGNTITNHNHLLANYPGADGIKTGYIRASGFNLIASAQEGGRRVIGVVLGGQSPRWRDRQMELLLNNGFAKLGINMNRNYAHRIVKRPTKVAARDEEEEADVIDVSAVDNETEQGDGVEGDWGLQIGAFTSAKRAREAALSARKIAQYWAKDASVNVVETAKGHQRLYRARLIGLDYNRAEYSCQKLKQNNIDCQVVPLASSRANS